MPKMQDPAMKKWFEELCLKWNVHYRQERG